MRNRSVFTPSPRFQSYSSISFPPDSPEFHWCGIYWCLLQPSPQGICTFHYVKLSHVSVGILVTSPTSWLLLPTRNQPLHTLSLCIWHSDLQFVKAWNLFSSMLISITLSISNWIWDAFCRLVFLSPPSVFMFGIGRSSRRTDNI